MRALYVGIAFCALLAIVALASRGERPSAGDARTRAVPGDFFDYIFTFSIVLGLAMLVIVAYYRASAAAQGKSGGWQVRQMVYFVVGVALVSGAAVVAAHELRDREGQRVGNQSGTATGIRTDAKGRPIVQREPEFEWEAVLIAAVLVGGGLGVYTLARRRKLPPERTLREDLAAILHDTLESLWAEEDPRRAVILAYAWMERTLAASGLPRKPSEAPLEYLARVLIELDASRESVFELTALFERAKFSTHEVDEEMKQEAIAALTAVRDELREAEAVAA